MVLNQLTISYNGILDMYRCYSTSSRKSVLGEAIVLGSKTAGPIIKATVPIAAKAVIPIPVIIAAVGAGAGLGCCVADNMSKVHIASMYCETRALESQTQVQIAMMENKTAIAVAKMQFKTKEFFSNNPYEGEKTAEYVSVDPNVGISIDLSNKTSGMVNSVLEQSWWFSSPTLTKTLVMWGAIALVLFILFRIRSHYKGLFLTKGIDIGGLHLNLFSLLSVLLVVLLNIMFYLCCMKFAYFDIIVESLHSGRLSSMGEISKVYTYIADSQIKIGEVHSAEMWAVLDTVRDLRSELDSVKIQSSQLQDEVVRLHMIMNGLDSASTNILSENVVTDSTTK
jgi:hypothetical protein